MSEGLEEALIIRFAKLKGIPKEEARKILAPILGDKDKVKEYLELLSFIDAVDTKPGSPADEVKEILKVQALASLAKAHEEKMNKDYLEDLLERAIRAQQALQIISKMFPADESPRNKYIEERLNRLEGMIEKLVEAIKQTREEKTSKEFINALSTLVDKINQQFRALAQRLEKLEKERLNINQMKKFLEELGFKVLKPSEMPLLDVDKAKELLRKLGYEIRPGWISADQLQKILEEERKKVYEQVRQEILKDVEKDRIAATKEAVITGFKVFADVLREVLKPIGRKIAEEVRETLEEMSEEEFNEAVEDLEKFVSSESELSPRGNKATKRKHLEEEELFIKVR